MFGCLISILFLWASRLSAFTAIKPSSRSSSFFIYLFILSTFTQSFLFYFFILFLLRSVAVRRVRGNKIRWYYFATKSTSKIVTNIFAHEINVIKRRGQIKKELYFVGSVWENICINTDIGIKWQQLRGWSYWLRAISCFKKWYRCSESTTGDLLVNESLKYRIAVLLIVCFDSKP